MAGGPADDGSTYSPMVAAIYVFNLIVGAGALAMPKAFAQSGYIAGAVMIAVLAFMSFMTVTFMIEAMAAANAFMRRNEEKKNSINNGTSTLDRYDAKTPLINARAETDSEFSIVSRAEMGAMAELFFPSWGVKAFYACIIIYLYGDLCIYAVAVPKSLKSVTCPVGHNATSNHSGHVTHYTTVPPPCLGSLDADASYRVYLLMFALLLGPFTFFNVQKTKWLQLFTTVMRWSTFLLMIIIAIIGLAGTQVFTPPEPVPEPESVSVADIKNLPALFGVSIYSFMCHHSLPSLLTPMTRKSTLNTVMVADFALILGFYCLLCFTAVFRFQGESSGNMNCLHACFSLPGISLNFGRLVHAELQAFQLGLCVLLPRSVPCFHAQCQFPYHCHHIAQQPQVTTEQSQPEDSPLGGKVCLSPSGYWPSHHCGFFHRQRRAAGRRDRLLCWSGNSIRHPCHVGILRKRQGGA
eukprot:TRINITY_DN11078_c0_g2_i2.p1 TRINITY_DN11078_c0_g2~~TRINITY_DN11078_c0_g2_i2.p1  ORF type:complete len:466 (+),score=55.88 TRINITY_DN11078_c0_g2_i2:191-1588(+)